MTLCIAAHAQHGGESRIVLCFDSLIGDDFGTVEAEFKCDPEFAPGLSVMFAGTWEDAEDAVQLYKDRLRRTPLTLAHVKEQLWVGMTEVKESLARHGREKTDVQLIVAGFVEGKAKILYADSEMVAGLPSFAAIGTGATAADVMLRWRKLSRHRPLHEAMYYVYEAKRVGETSPFVGKMTTMFVLEPKDGLLLVQTVVPQGIKFLRSQFEKFGPQEFVSDPHDRFPNEGLA